MDSAPSPGPRGTHNEPEYEPIDREPRRVRPPYNVRDESFDHITGTDAWRTALRADRLAALREPLAGLTVTDYEVRTLEWLCGWEPSTVAVVAGLLHRAREAEPLALALPACSGADDLCGAPAGQPCEPGCPSLAADPESFDVGRPECADCDDEFDPDTSPHADRCWSCAELADAQAGGAR